MDGIHLPFVTQRAKEAHFAQTLSLYESGERGLYWCIEALPLEDRARFLLAIMPSLQNLIECHYQLVKALFRAGVLLASDALQALISEEQDRLAREEGLVRNEGPADPSRPRYVRPVRLVSASEHPMGMPAAQRPDGE